MKRLVYILLLLTGTIHNLQAQNENGVKDFGGFILDMGTMLNAESLTVDMYLPPLSLIGAMPETSPLQINPDAFRITPNITYMKGMSITSSYPSIMSLIYNGMGTGIVNWQGTSYKLNNGMRINLYGEYDADGRKVYNPSALPWERNNFNAAFEMKSANGNFGIKVEVHRGRNNPY
ncbi:MAG: occludin [Bacteroidaceae bacterium]|nr:occludin [Bacteroidaceae bacterium]